MRMAPVGPPLGQKRPPAVAQQQAPLLQHRFEHRIPGQQQLMFMELQRHMAIPQVIRRLQQLQRTGRLHPHQILRRSNHLHLDQTGGIGEAFPRTKRSIPRHLQQDVLSAGGLTTTTQHRALFRRQRQQQSLARIRQHLIPTGTTPLQHDQGVLHQHSGFRTEACPGSEPGLVWVATKPWVTEAEPGGMKRHDPWHGRCQLHFARDVSGRSRHQGGCTAPFKLMRADIGDDGRCELPLLHTAGGLVGGDQLSIDLQLERDSRGLITSVAAQKVYGSIGRSRVQPEGRWAQQAVTAELGDGSDLEWLPQELVLYADALHEQSLSVTLPENASFLSAEIVRLGRTAAEEQLNRGRWRSNLTIQRSGGTQPRWELVDRLELGGDSLQSLHGLHGAPVFGTLVWAAPHPLSSPQRDTLLDGARADRAGLEGTMRCSSLDQGLLARYVGPSSRDARFWFSRIWARTRALRSLSKPRIPRVWPLQEEPFGRQTFIPNPTAIAAATH